MEEVDLFRAFIEKELGEPLDSQEPRYLSGWEVVEALWPLNEVFRPHLAQVRSLPYDAAFESEADAAIKDTTMAAWPPQWEDLSAGVWRVLFERHIQAILVAATNEAAGNPLMPVPARLPETALTGAAMIFLMHKMKLPWPPGDRAGYELPTGSARASLRRH